MNADSIQLVINTIGTALSKYGPAALDTMLKVVRYQGLGAVLAGLTVWTTSIPLCVFGFRCWSRADKEHNVDWRFASVPIWLLFVFGLAISDLTVIIKNKSKLRKLGVLKYDR